MNAKKQRDKSRRRANNLAQQAWDAADDNNFDLAVKIIRRAVELNPANPVLWHDQAMLLLQLNDEENAVRSFEAAIYLAPDFAEAYASLAAIQARRGNLEQAVTLQGEAVRHAPESERNQCALAAYKALLAGRRGSDARPDSPTPMQSPEVRIEHEPNPNELSDLAYRIESLNWQELDDQLTRHGYVCLPGLLSADQCEWLRTMFGDRQRFAKTVTMNKNRFGKGVYRYFAAPLPDLVDAIRRQVYPHVAAIVNRWQQVLDDNNLYPAT